MLAGVVLRLGGELVGAEGCAVKVALRLLDVLRVWVLLMGASRLLVEGLGVVD